MRVLYLSLALFVAILVVSLSGVAAEQNDGACAACTIATGIIMEISLAQKLSGVEAFDLFCNSIAQDYEPMVKPCQFISQVVGTALQTALTLNMSPDKLCQTVTVCDGTCKLFETWPPQGLTTSPAEARANIGPLQYTVNQQLLEESTVVSLMDSFASIMPFATVPQQPFPELPTDNSLGSIIDWLKKLLTDWTTEEIDSVFNMHYPLVDHDDDRFSTEPVFRGSDWRGKDCDDKNSNVYPGRAVEDGDSEIDSNCNGIYGVDNSTGQTFENLYCADYQQRGLIVLGDSAAAHFSVPPAWMTAKGFNNQTYDKLFHTAMNEFDWPACSWSTGTWNAEDCPWFNENAPYKSLQQRLFNRNHCNHRDFQNIGVNGASTTNVNPEVDEGNIYSIQRDHNKDVPALVFYVLIGNDVCNGHPGLDRMTTVEEMTANVKTSMEYLDVILPKGSTVVTIALADGRILYDTMQDQIHPILVTYPQVYDYLDCVNSNPCWGWLNTNETWRDLTTERAQNLSAVYTEVKKANTYENFDMLYFDPNWDAIVSDWTATGQPAADLIEKIDGFHPSQTGQNLLADKIWKWLEKNHPEALGDTNPNNDAIKAQFGKQGGF